SRSGDLRTKPRTQLRQRAVEGQAACGLVERRPLEQEADRKVPTQCDGEAAGGHAIRPLLDLADDSGPPAKREQFRAQVVGTLVIMDSEADEGVGHRLECITASLLIVRDNLGERTRPASAERRERRPVQLEETAVNATAAVGHEPVREALIQVAGQK